MLRFDGQDIAADRLCLFRFVERAIEFSLRDGLSNPSCRNALNLIFHGFFPPRSNFSGTVNLRTEPYFPIRQFHQRPDWKSAAPGFTPASNATTLGTTVHDSRLPPRLLLIVLKPSTSRLRTSLLAVISLPNCSNILCEELIQIVRHLKDTGFQRSRRACFLDHDIMLLSLSAVPT